MSSLSTKIVKEAVKAGLPQPICEKTVSFTLGFKAALEDKQFSDPDQPKYVFFTILVVLTHTYHTLYVYTCLYVSVESFGDSHTHSMKMIIVKHKLT